MENYVLKYHPNEFKTFYHYKADCQSKLEYLEAISIRYKEDIENKQQISKKLKEVMEEGKDLQQKSEVIKQACYNLTLLTLDVDSFYLYANIFLDRIPFLLKIIYKDKVTKADIPKKYYENFRVYVDWFKNPQPKTSPQFVDSIFKQKIILYESWFYENIRNPRNKLITHTYFNTFGVWVDSLGNMQRPYITSSNNKNNDIKFLSINLLFEKIIEFLGFLNSYFTDSSIKPTVII
jgi:hypothetical protein